MNMTSMNSSGLEVQRIEKTHEKQKKRNKGKKITKLIKGEYLVKNTTDIRIDVIFYD